MVKVYRVKVLSEVFGTAYIGSYVSVGKSGVYYFYVVWGSRNGAEGLFIKVAQEILLTVLFCT